MNKPWPTLREWQPPNDTELKQLEAMVNHLTKQTPLDIKINYPLLKAALQYNTAITNEDWQKRFTILLADTISKYYMGQHHDVVLDVFENIPTLQIQDNQLSISALEYASLPRQLNNNLTLRYMIIKKGQVILNSKQLHVVLMNHLVNQKPPKLDIFKPTKDQAKPYFALNQKIHAAARSEAQSANQARELELLPDHYPPCIKNFIERLKEGDLLAHPERFNLVAFFNYYGLTADEIAKIFQSSPNYKAGITEYQVKHITSGGKEGKGYLTMSCSQIRALGVCPDENCAGPTPIINYAKRHKAWKNSQQKPKRYIPGKN